MLECIFTIDYEIYGNGQGSLRELILHPARQLKSIFDQACAKCVVFVEAVELEKIERAGTDSAIGDVKRQIKEFHDEGFEIGLHLHPQWCNARYQNGKWALDYTEYNLCRLPEQRIDEIVRNSISYLQDILQVPNFVPLSFRAGNWLFQPTAAAARVLAKHGVRIDSSVFKGGLQHKHGLDYRQALKNGSYWMFKDDVTIPDPRGPLLELPTYTMMVPFWKLLTRKRIALQRKANASVRDPKSLRSRIFDLIRFRQPLKFDFCRMRFDELLTVIERATREDEATPELFRPLVAIGHTKDLVDFHDLKVFLAYLKEKAIPVSTFERAYRKCRPWLTIDAATRLDLAPNTL